MNPTTSSLEPFNMEDSILMDFSELDTLTDFFPTTALLHGNNNSSSNSGPPPHSTDNDDFLTNSDQWSSISNLIHLNTTTNNNNTNDNNNNNDSNTPVASHPNSSHTNHQMNSNNTNPIMMTTHQNSFTFRDDDPSGGGGGVDGNSSSSTTAAAPRIPTAVYTASTVPVQEPNPNDVLLGRGGKNNQWSGNETLREMARNMSTMYAAAPKRNKPAIAMLLVQQMRALTPAGRYVVCGDGTSYIYMCVCCWGILVSPALHYSIHALFIFLHYIFMIY